MGSRMAAAATIAAAALASTPRAGAQAPLPASELAVATADGAWQTWWRSRAAPARWGAPDAVLAAAARWEPVAPGIETAELRLAGRGEAWRTKAVLVRIDPRVARLRVVQPPPGQRTWTVDDAPAAAPVAFNAGQFTGESAWGWLVRDGVERLSPGRGPLAPAVVVRASGEVAIVPADSVAALRPLVASGQVAQAFQSYPALLLGDGEVPRALRADNPHVDVAHRDARLGFGVLRDGRVLVALTRFDGLGEALSRVPFGLTTPEMAALMGALGCTRAVALDGGISAQLRVGEREWKGMRRVPVGLVVEPR